MGKGPGAAQGRRSPRKMKGQMLSDQMQVDLSSTKQITSGDSSYLGQTPLPHLNSLREGTSQSFS